MMITRALPSILLLILCSCLTVRAAALPEAIEAVRSVEGEGAGHVAAAAAWKDLSQAGAADFDSLLSGMNDANPLAQNWMRTALEAVSDRLIKEGTFPTATLSEFIQDRSHDSAPRLLAYELLLRAAPATAAELKPTFIDDPAPDLRLHAVAELIDQGLEAKKEGNSEEAVAILRRALDAARDEGQIETLAKTLRDLKEPVDLPRHFGFLMNWHLIAPFTNVERKGFDTVFPPENEIKLSASYPGKGTEAAWVSFTSDDDYGLIDFNKAFDTLKEVTGYAYTEFESAEERSAEIRLGCKNGWKVWFNGELLFGRDEYHRGMKLDQYKLPVQLKKGVNTVLVKCCQNEQTEQWTVEWQFQLRICDPTGTAIHAVAP